MDASLPINALSLSEEELATIARVFGAGRRHPWSDPLIDQTLDLMDGVLVEYLKAKRDPAALRPFIQQFALLLDKIIMERFEDLRAAAKDIHEYPPYWTRDRWPVADLPTISRVINWAFDLAKP